MEIFSKLGREHGLETDRQWGARLDVADTTIMRLFAGRTVPGNGFIARALTAFPDASFYDLFEVTNRKPARRRASRAAS